MNEKFQKVGKETFKNLGYYSTLEILYKTLIEKEIKEDITILNNMKRVTEMIEELKEFTKNY